MVVPPLRRFEAQKRKKWVFLSVWPIKLVSWSQENGNALRTPLKRTKKNLQPGSLVVSKGLEGVQKKKNGRSLSFVKVPGKKKTEASHSIFWWISPHENCHGREEWCVKDFFFWNTPFLHSQETKSKQPSSIRKLGFHEGAAGVLGANNQDKIDSNAQFFL